MTSDQRLAARRRPHAKQNRGIPGPSMMPFLRCQGRATIMLTRTQTAARTPRARVPGVEPVRAPRSSQVAAKVMGRSIGISFLAIITFFIFITTRIRVMAQPKRTRVRRLSGSVPEAETEIPYATVNQPMTKQARPTMLIGWLAAFFICSDVFLSTTPATTSIAPTPRVRNLEELRLRDIFIFCFCLVFLYNTRL